MTKDEALKLALEAFNDLAAWNDGEVGSHMDEPYAAEVARRTITAIKEALAQPAVTESHKQEPDWKGLVLSHNEDCESRCDMDRCGYKPYYEYNGRRCPDCPIHEKIWVEYTPPQRKPLTDEEIYSITGVENRDEMMHRMARNIARAIEAAHGIGCETTLVKGEA